MRWQVDDNDPHHDDNNDVRCDEGDSWHSDFNPLRLVSGGVSSP